MCFLNGASEILYQLVQCLHPVPLNQDLLHHCFVSLFKLLTQTEFLAVCFAQLLGQQRVLKVVFVVCLRLLFELLNFLGDRGVAFVQHLCLAFQILKSQLAHVVGLQQEVFLLLELLQLSLESNQV